MGWETWAGQGQWPFPRPLSDGLGWESEEGYPSPWFTQLPERLARSTVLPRASEAWWQGRDSNAAASVSSSTLPTSPGTL